MEDDEEEEVEDEQEPEGEGLDSEVFVNTFCDF